MTEHQLKIWPQFFADLRGGLKTWEVRKNDRDPGFAVRDTLVLCEWVPGDGYTGQSEVRRVSYVADLTSIGLIGYVGMTLEEP